MTCVREGGLSVTINQSIIICRRENKQLLNYYKYI